MEMVTTMKKSPRIFGLYQLFQLQYHLRRLNFDERGFIFSEFVIGLPLIIILLLSLNNIFVNAWTNCKYMFADFIIQQEMESAMNRIVTDAQIAYAIEPPEKYGRLRFYQHEMQALDNLKERYNDGKPWYKSQNGKIYYNGETSPITGDNVLSGTFIRKFEYYQKPNHPKLLYIKIEAESAITNHRITLTTEVFMRGLQ